MIVIGKKSSLGSKLLTLFCFVYSLVASSGCSYLKKDPSYAIEKQIERQQRQQEIASEPVEKENKTAREYEDLGDRHLLQGDINRAYIYYVKGLSKEPENTSLLHKQAKLLLKKNMVDEAGIVYEKLLTINSSDVAAIEGKGRACFGQSKFGDAEKLFLSVLEIKPDQWQSHEYLGLIYSKDEKYLQAINRFKTALVYQPQNARIENNLALTYFLNGNIHEAVKMYELLANRSKDKKVFNNLAIVYCHLGRYNEALAAFKKGADIEAVAYNNIGYEYLRNEKYDKAIEAFKKAIELYPKYYPSAQSNLDIAMRLQYPQDSE